MSDPETYEDAIAQGYEPISEAEARRTRRIRSKGLARPEAALSETISCARELPGTICFDWTDDEGVRTICFCTAAKTCGHCVKKKIIRDPR